MITLIGLGAGDSETLSRGAERALRTASKHQERGTGRLFLRTLMHPVVTTLVEWGLTFESFDELYDTSPDFAYVYETIVNRVIDFAIDSNGEQTPIAFAVPGHPLFAEDSVRQILQLAKSRGIETQIVSSGSFVEAVMTAVGASLGDGCDVRDALALTLHDAISETGSRISSRIDVTRNLMLYQVFDKASASHAKLALMRDYPDDWEVTLVRWAGVPDKEEVKRVPLFRLDREFVDYLTSVFVPPLPDSLRKNTFNELVGLMAKLRSPEGCPWDREQSHKSLRKYFIEETYEVIEAIDNEDSDLLCEELGDALLQVVFHAQIASEEGVFNIDDITQQIVDKLVKRHPHVFGTVEVSGSAEVLKNWEQIKRAEKTEKDANWRSSALDGVPVGLPALMQALEISKKAVKVGFEWDSFEQVIGKADEELAELKAELFAEAPDKKRVLAELGDLLFTIVQVARWQKLDPEEALRTMVQRFSHRFRTMEGLAIDQGDRLEELPLSQQDLLWNRAKELTKSKES